MSVPVPISTTDLQRVYKHILTKAQYTELLTNDAINENDEYYITDAETSVDTITIGATQYSAVDGNIALPAYPDVEHGAANLNLTYDESTVSSNQISVNFGEDQRNYYIYNIENSFPTCTLNINSLNQSDNYILFINASSTDTELSIGTVTYSGTVVSRIVERQAGITIPANTAIEISILCVGNSTNGYTAIVTASAKMIIR